MPPRTADLAARTRRAYALRMSRRAPNLAVAAVLVYVAVSLARFGDDGLTLAAIAAGAALVLALWALRSRLVLDGDRLELRTIFGSRTIRRDEIDGLQRIVSRYGQTSTRLFLRNGRGVVTVSGGFTGNDDLERWLDGLPDIDERNAARIEQTIDRQERAGAGAPAHEVVLGSARRWMVASSAAAVVAGVAAAVPYRPISAAGMAALMLFPPLGIALLYRFPLRFTMFKAKVDPRADLTLLVLLPAFGILLPGTFGGDPSHLVDSGPLMRWYVPVCLALVTALARIAWKSPARWAGVFLLLFLGSAYSVGLVNAADTIPDESSPSFFRTWVVRKHEVHHSRSTDLDLRVAPWGPIAYASDISVPAAIYRRSAVGDPVCLGLHGGFLHAAWYELVPCAGPLVRDAALSVPETAQEAGALLADAQREAAQRPRDAHAQFVLGQCYIQLERYDDALPPLLAAERLDTADAWTHNAIGWVLNQQRKYAIAVPHLQAAVALDSTYAEAQHNLGWAYLRLDDLPDAERTYRVVVRLKPESADAARQYAWVLEHLHGAHAADGEIARALALEPDNGDIQAYAGHLFRNEGRFADARQHYETASRLLPNSAAVWAELAATDFLMNDRAASAAAFAHAARVDSSYVRNRPNLMSMWRWVAPSAAR